MAERKPYTTKTRQIILEYLKRQQAVTVSVSDIEEYLKDEGIRINTTTVYRYLDKLCTEHLHLKCIKCGKIVHLDCDFMDELREHLYQDHGFRLQCSGRYASWNLPGL